MTKILLEECTNIVKELAGNEYLYFDNAIEIKPTPHSLAFTIWGISCSPRNQLYIMDNNQEWHHIDIEDAYAPLIIGSLYQRLKLLRINYAKAS